MDDLNWLVKRRFKEAIRHEHSWDFIFDDDAWLTTGCLWRLLEQGRIRTTNTDDGHRFGLPAPVDAALRVNERLADATVTAVVLQAGTLDLEIRFETGHVLQIIPESSGYESWSAGDTLRKYRAIAVGGGELAVFRDGVSA